MFFTTEKISCTLARISSFFQNYFPLIPIMVSTSSKIALTKKTALTSKKALTTDSNWLLSKENGKKLFSLARKSVTLSKTWSFLKNWLPLILVTVSTKKKKLWTKKMVCTKFVCPGRKKFTLAQVFFKNWIPPKFNNSFH